MTLNVTARHAALAAVAAVATRLSIHTLTDPGTGASANAGEASGVVRQTIAWTTPAGEEMANTADLAWDLPAGEYGFFTLHTTGGGYLGFLPFGGADAKRGLFTVDPTLTTDTLRAPGHGLANGDRVMLAWPGLPTGLSEATIYFVVGVTSATFQVSATLGGAAVDITAAGDGEGIWQRIVPITIPEGGGTITAAAGAVALDALWG